MGSTKREKKILFYYSKLNTGGAEKVTIQLMKLLSKKGWSVDLLLEFAGGSLEYSLSEQINVIHLSKKSYPALILSYPSFFLRVILSLYLFPFYIFQRLNRYFKLSKMRKRKYDIAVIGLQGLNSNIIANKINASKKLHWIHNDLLYCDPTGRVKNNILKNSNKIDCYPCVSSSVYKSFCETLPSLKSKARIFYNVIDSESIIKSANDVCDIEGKFDNALRVITVCRVVDKAKGVFRMLDVYKKLRSEGIFFYWIVVGEGVDFNELLYRSKQSKLDDGFILIGQKSNPFPYYKYCNLSATLSYYEGFVTTVSEAKIIGLPVIATEFSGVREQIEHGKTGWIVDNNEDAIYHGLKKILLDKGLLKKITNSTLPKEIFDDDYKEEVLRKMIS